MKFWIDFEATQYSERIISIGCISEHGETFKSLVRPLDKKSKITPFIENLTGITQEMIDEAPDTNQVFMQFYNWISIRTVKPEFYCFGNCDINFVKRTLKDVTDFRAVIALSLIHASLIDCGPEIASFFNRSTIKLKHVYNILKAEENEQTHDALEDATMLKYVFENREKLADSSLQEEVKSVSKSDKRAPAIYTSWNCDKWVADTKADETNYQYKCICPNGLEKYFDSIETTVLWVIKYLTKGKSPKSPEHIKQISSTIEKAIVTGKKSYGFTWENNIKEIINNDNTLDFSCS